MIESQSSVLESTGIGWRERLGDYVELTKPRLTLLNVLCTMAGFYLGTHGELDTMVLVHTLVGTFMVGGGCGALNMFVEREHDALMRRTMTRPIPAGRISPTEALVIGTLLAVGGVIYLAVATTPLAGLLALATLVSYVFLYTPMKRLSTLNTVIGGIPGALPPVIGLAAAGNMVLSDAFVLFAILFFWQMPHFLSLAWMYRRDYERAGYVMLPNLDPQGVSTSRQILLWSAGLIPVSLLPKLVGMSGAIYFFGALALGLGFVAFAIVLSLSESRRNVHAKWVFYYSLLYLPILMLSMVLDRSGL